MKAPKRTSLPKPYYDDGRGIVIYHGDCFEIAPKLGRFDLLLTDPPYGHGSKWGGGTWATNPIYKDAFEWDAKPVDNNLLFELTTRCNKSIVWGGNYYQLPPSRCWLAWEKNPKMDTMADFELAWTNLNRPSKLFFENRNPDGKREHPTQKPISLIQWCIYQAKEAQTILDCFMGSGTTLRAAKNLQKKCTAIDLSEKYCEIAARKLQQEVLL